MVQLNLSLISTVVDVDVRWIKLVIDGIIFGCSGSQLMWNNWKWLKDRVRRKSLKNNGDSLGLNDQFVFMSPLLLSISAPIENDENWWANSSDPTKILKIWTRIDIICPLLENKFEANLVNSRFGKSQNVFGGKRAELVVGKLKGLFMSLLSLQSSYLSHLISIFMALFLAKNTCQTQNKQLSTPKTIP